MDRSVHGVVVVLHELVQNVEPVLGVLRVKIFPHHRFQGPVEPLDDRGLLLGPRGEVLHLVFFQQRFHADVIELLSLVELDDGRILPEPLLEFFQENVHGLCHALRVFSVHGNRERVPAQDFHAGQNSVVALVFPPVLLHVDQIQLQLVREVLNERFQVLARPNFPLESRVRVLVL